MLRRQFDGQQIEQKLDRPAEPNARSNNNTTTTRRSSSQRTKGVFVYYREWSAAGSSRSKWRSSANIETAVSTKRNGWCCDGDVAERRLTGSVVAAATDLSHRSNKSHSWLRRSRQHHTAFRPPDSVPSDHLCFIWKVIAARGTTTSRATPHGFRTGASPQQRAAKTLMQ